MNGSSPRPGSGRSRRLRLAAVGPASGLASGAVAALAVAAILTLGGCAGPATAPGPSAAASDAHAGGTGGDGAPAPVGGATAAASPPPAASPSPAASSSPSGSPDRSASASPAPSEASPAGAAPTSAAGFKVRDTIVPMTFPLPATAAHRYGDGWRAPRVGVARSYNQIRGVAPDGSYLRAHDGLDLLVKLKTPVLAPFAGRVIDPAKRWKPWDPSRYGKVVAIESTEPTSPGYTVILAHLSSVAVKVGDEVQRGQVVGKTGRTGNAAGTPPHLHLEIRAPFRIRYGYAGVIRRLDVFDAEPSVRAVDPKAR